MMMPSIVSSGAQLVDAQRRERDAQRGEEVHAPAPAVSARRAASAAFASAGALRVSDDLPVAERDEPRRERRDVLLVRDERRS
jgi:hypothetical protein